MGFLPVIIVVALIAYFILRSRRPGVQQVALEHLPDTFVVFDLETTGLKAETHEIIEVGAIRFKKGTTKHDTFQTLVKPKRAIPKKITDSNERSR